jgi:hypothetical protein
MGISLRHDGTERLSKGRHIETKAIDEALGHIREAVDEELAASRALAAQIDPTSVIRFSDHVAGELPPTERRALQARAEELRPWRQGPFLLGGDLVVTGTERSDRRWADLDREVPESLSNKRVLVLPSGAGYDAFMFRRRDAAYVLACERTRFHDQALFLESVYKAGVDFHQIGWEDLNPETHGSFDLIHCHSLLDQVLHPLQLLERLRQMLGEDGILLLGSLLLSDPELSEYVRFIPASSEHGGSSWLPGRLAVRWMLEAVGFVVEAEFARQEALARPSRAVTSYFRASG